MGTQRHIGRPLAIVATLGALALVMPAWPATVGAAAGDLRAQVLELSEREGFLVSGLDQIQEGAPSRAPQVRGLARRISALLNGYNYVLLHNVAATTWSRLRSPAPTGSAIRWP
jgi:hypothetical protein